MDDYVKVPMPLRAEKKCFSTHPASSKQSNCPLQYTKNPATTKPVLWVSGWDFAGCDVLGAGTP